MTTRQRNTLAQYGPMILGLFIHLCALLIWGARLDARQSATEEKADEAVPRTEFRAAINRLDRIENKVDRLLERD